MNSMLCFGYGSLANTGTIPGHIPLFNARLHGWRRFWGHRTNTPWGRVCALTIESSPSTSIEGVALSVSREEIEEFDAREIGYVRTSIEIGLCSSLTPDVRQAIAYIAPIDLAAENAIYPIWRSYIDCVLLGYLRLFGKKGVRNFIETTYGWDAPILEDRDEPRYPRAVSLDGRERKFFDLLVAEAITQRVARRE